MVINRFLALYFTNNQNIMANSLYNEKKSIIFVLKTIK